MCFLIGILCVSQKIKHITWSQTIFLLPNNMISVLWYGLEKMLYVAWHMRVWFGFVGFFQNWKQYWNNNLCYHSIWEHREAFRPFSFWSETVKEVALFKTRTKHVAVDQFYHYLGQSLKSLLFMSNVLKLYLCHVLTTTMSVWFHF